MNIAELIAYNIPKFLLGLLLLFVLSFILAEKYQGIIKKNKRLSLILIVVVVLLGLLSRLDFAYFFRGNFDIWYYGEIAKIGIQGKNIYQESDLYVYFPPWIIILTFLKKIHLLIPNVNFYFILRAFLTLVDLGSLYLLWLISKIFKKNFLTVAVAFFLNPVSVLITGFHGQFENIPIFLILLAIYIYLKYKKNHLAWFIYTGAAITKHMFFNQPLIYLKNIYKKNIVKVLFWFMLSGFLALLTLIPYWPNGKHAIINNLLFYSHTKTSYGVVFLLEKLGFTHIEQIYKYFFLLVFSITPLLIKKQNLLRNSLIGTLLFIVFTPAISDQYFILPIALGAINQTFWLLFYSIFASLYLFGSSAQFNIEFFKIFSNNYIFLISFMWLFWELKHGKN